MDRFETVKEMIESERNQFMEKSWKSLSEIEDYELFQKEVLLIANYVEYRKHMYQEHIKSIWYQSIQLVNRDVYNKNDQVCIDDNSLIDMEHYIVNEITNYIKDDNLTYIEAWERVRSDLVDGKYSVVNHIDKIYW